MALVIGGERLHVNLSTFLGNTFSEVKIQVRSKDVFDGIKQGENKIYLPGKKIKQRTTLLSIGMKYHQK